MPLLLRRRPSPALVVASLALFVALGGPASAAHLIDGKTIRRNSITNAQIRNHTIKTVDLSALAYKTLRTTPARSVGATQLRDGAVGSRALAPGSVDATKLAAGAVGNAQLAARAVDAGKLADGAVGSTQLAGGAVTSSKIADGSVGAAAIADGGLQTRDLGDFYGSVTISFGDFTADQCKESTILNPQPAAPGQSNSIADDIVSASPTTSGWPDQILVVANPGAGNTIRVVACRIGSDPTEAIPAPTTTFYYVAFDTP
ncbi:hypothetical protein [Conexibacter woesei]|uniref:hypothetical protein n=1 Tax=Conexibacter woesei TaxID=191495 RepID=UPI0012DDD877|nr:hypothetical protein [Conexibacter woesei]